MAATIRNTPRNSALYGAGSVLQRIKQALNRPTTLSPEEKRVFGSKLNISLGDLLMGQAPETLQDWSYEGSRGPISGRNIQTLKVDPRVLDVAGLAAVGAPVAAKAAKAAAPTAAKQAVSLMEKYGVSPEMYVIKPEGGQWLSDENSGIERLLRNLRELPYDDDLARAAGATEEDIARAQPRKQQVEAHNKWLDTTLKKYIKQRMATPSDEIRKLADQGITHITKEALDERAPHIARLTNTIKDRADYAGIPYEQVATTKAGQTWENLADYGVYPNKVEDLTGSAEPWMSKLDPKDIVHHLAVQRADEYGFDHMMDVLRQDLEAGRIRPENINKLSVEQMVRRTHEYDKEMAKRMEEQALQEQAGLPLVKEYPEGYRWLELHAKDDPDLTAKALEYEGNKMGHCVGGYCDDVTEGKSQIFSLRDKKGEPHVTIEVKPPNLKRTQLWKDYFREEVRSAGNNEYLDKYLKDTDWGPKTSVNDAAIDANFIPWIKENYPERLAELENIPPTIVQIKGKQNRAPKKEYLPFVQDFVKSGNWESVGDISNAGLVDLEEAGVPEIMRGGKRFATPEEYSQMVNENAKATYAKGGMVDIEKMTAGDKAKAMLKGLALRWGKYPIMATNHGAYPDLIKAHLKNQYSEELGTRRGNRTPLDVAINYGGVYDLASNPKMDVKDLQDMALAYQLYDYITGDKADAIRDYKENMAGIAGAQADRVANRRVSDQEVAKRARDYAKQQSTTEPQYAEGGLVYDDSHIDQLAEQLLG